MKNTHLKSSSALINFQTPTGKAHREEGNTAKKSGKVWHACVKGRIQRLAEVSSLPSPVLQKLSLKIEAKLNILCCHKGESVA